MNHSILALAGAWLLTTVDQNGGISNLHVVDSERICREAVCSATYNASCGAHAATVAKAIRRQKAQIAAEAKEDAAWVKAHPESAKGCTPLPTGFAMGTDGASRVTMRVREGANGRCGVVRTTMLPFVPEADDGPPMNRCTPVGR